MTIPPFQVFWITVFILVGHVHAQTTQTTEEPGYLSDKIDWCTQEKASCGASIGVGLACFFLLLFILKKIWDRRKQRKAQVADKARKVEEGQRTEIALFEHQARTTAERNEALGVLLGLGAKHAGSALTKYSERHGR